MVKFFIGKLLLAEKQDNLKNVGQYISEFTGLHEKDFYLLQNGKLLDNTCEADPNYSIHCIIRVIGGKGGFGSMLRAIGAQIEKTTNREACRDLSGRRLRDINEEKRLKSWLEKQADRDREAEERKKKKIEKLLHVPKHDFKDEKYETTRENLTEKVNDAVTEGLNKALIADPNKESRKRKALKSDEGVKKRKTALWIDDAISSSDESSDDDKQLKKD